MQAQGPEDTSQPTERTGRTGGGKRPRARKNVKAREISPSRSRLSRILGHTGLILIPILLLTGLAFATIYVRLLHGPISLGFLVTPIEQALATELGGDKIEVDDAQVRLTGNGGLEFRLTNVRLSDPAGTPIASAPLAALQFSGRALWSARIAPKRIELIDLRLLVFYSDEDGLRLSIARQGEGAAAIGDVPAPRPARRPPAQGHDGTQQPKPDLRDTAHDVTVHDANGLPAALQQVDLARMLADITSRARRGQDATSNLREIGLRNATIVLNHSGAISVWRVPEAAVDLEHRRQRSLLSGKATIVSARGPWSMHFDAEESDGTERIDLKLSVRGLVPSTLSLALPQFAMLDGLDVPVSGDANLGFSRGGELIEAAIGLELSRGNVKLPWLADASFALDAGQVSLSYNRTRKHIEITPSNLSWGNSRITLVGGLRSDRAETGEALWVFELNATDGQIADEDFGNAVVPIDLWRMSGFASQERRYVQLNQFQVRAGDGEFALAGVIDADNAIDGPGASFQGRLGEMSAATLKALWPRALAPGARDWVGARVGKGKIQGGSLTWLTGGFLANEVASPGSANQRLSLTIEAADISMSPMADLPPVTAPRALIRLESGALEVTIPEATIETARGKSLPLSAGRFTAPDLFADRPVGELAFRVRAQLAPVLTLLRHPKLHLLHDSGMKLDALNGKVDGQFKVSIPLIEDLPADAVKIIGRARITDGSAKQLIGPYDISGGVITVDVNETALEAQGNLILAGILAKLSWQRIFDAPAERQPPLRITALLDNSDRTQLGLDVNHIVQGEIPVELTIAGIANPGQPPQALIRADLTNAELTLDNLAWRKAPGRKAHLQFSIQEGRDSTELTDFRIVGDDIAIDGTVVIGANNVLREFDFPNFTLNVVTQLSMKGKLRPDNILEVVVDGRHYEGRAFFRSLFSVGEDATRARNATQNRAGIDVKATFDTVAGFSDVTLREVSMTASQRNGKLVVLDARGTLDGGAPISARVRQIQGKPRQLIAVSPDAGQAFRLIGFYPNMQGGDLRLEVNLDGTGPAEKTGTLWIQKFRILGDAIVTEVASSAGGAGSRSVLRQVFDFNLMRAPFSVGHGQFVLGESYARGDLIGASLRGKIDFKAQLLSLGGTYIPLQGLNNALGNIPVIGDLLSGPRKEGIIGITFAVNGSMQQPQVTFHPLSPFAPGIFREVFQLAPPSQDVTPRTGAPGDGRPKVRSSSTQSQSRATGGTARQPEILGGWSSEAQPAPGRR